MTEQKMTNLPQVYTTRNEDIYGEETVNMKDFIIGALVGGIVGAAAGLLLAQNLVVIYVELSLHRL